MQVVDFEDNNVSSPYPPLAFLVENCLQEQCHLGFRPHILGSWHWEGFGRGRWRGIVLRVTSWTPEGLILQHRDWNFFGLSMLRLCLLSSINDVISDYFVGRDVRPASKLVQPK